MNGKTIRIYLVDGMPTGILMAEIINWTGMILVAPRNQLAELAKQEEVKRTGVYCLCGPDPENPTRDIVYIGEGDNVLTRLSAHDKDVNKEFWTRCAVIISKDENLTKAHGRFLESRLINMAHDAVRAKIVNGTAPPRPPLPKPDVADMEFFLTQLQIVLPVLGFGFLQPLPSFELDGQPQGSDESPLFCLSTGDAKAYAREIGRDFVVLKGSTARKEDRSYWTSYKGQRNQLVADGILVDSNVPGLYVFKEDASLSSPSAGAAIVAAGNMNGRISWKVSDTGLTYQEWYDRKLAAAGGGVEESDE